LALPCNFPEEKSMVAPHLAPLMAGIPAGNILHRRHEGK